MSKKRKMQDIETVIQRRKENLNIKLGYKDLLVRVVFLVAVVYVLFHCVFLVTQAKGNDMFPAVKDGDLVLVFRLHQDYQKNDVVAYEVDGELHIGRILARETDVVTLDESGTLLVNGTVQTGEILFPTYPKEKLVYPYKVPEGEVFILGDYRTQATDSRDYGSISYNNVKGKVITILRRRGI